MCASHWVYTKPTGAMRVIWADPLDGRRQRVGTFTAAYILVESSDSAFVLGSHRVLVGK